MLPLAEVLAAMSGYLLLLFAGFHAYAAACRRRRPDAGDYVVVLGSTLEGGRITPLLASRLDAALDTGRHLRSHGADPRFVLAGGPKAPGLQPEAHAMADYLRQAGVADDRLLIEDTSTSTEQNLRNAMRVMAAAGLPRGDRCVIVTSDYHCPRVAVLARRGAVSAVLVGAPGVSLRWMLRDFAAFVATCWKPVTVAAGIIATATVLLAA